MAVYRDFLCNERIRFGAGAVDSLGTLAAGYGKTALLVTGGASLRESGQLDRVAGLLAAAGVSVALAPPIAREPRVDDIEAALAACRDGGCGVVVSVGGGSVMDSGKAVAGIAPNAGRVVDYLEGCGRDLVLEQDPLPHVAVPTTAGTGSETTKNGVVAVPELGVKRSVRDDRLIPTVALLDPELAVRCPPRQTAYSGLDALSQLVESFVSKNASPFTDALAIEGIRRVGRALERAVRQGDALEARADMAFAAAASGLTLANAGLGLVHALAGPLGGMRDAPHGCLCGMLLAPVMRFNVEHALERYAMVGRLLTGNWITEDEVAAEGGIAWVERVADEFDLPQSLAVFGITEEMLPDVVQRCNPGPLKTNPREATPDELADLCRIVGVLS